MSKGYYFVSPESLKFPSVLPKNETFKQEIVEDAIYTPRRIKAILEKVAYCNSNEVNELVELIKCGVSSEGYKLYFEDIFRMTASILSSKNISRCTALYIAEAGVLSLIDATSNPDVLKKINPFYLRLKFRILQKGIEETISTFKKMSLLSNFFDEINKVDKNVSKRERKFYSSIRLQVEQETFYLLAKMIRETRKCL